MTIPSKIKQSAPKRYAKTWQSVNKVEKYAHKRYKHLDQRLISYIEQEKVHKILHQILLPGDTILDIPTGYGRFTPLFREHNVRIISADLNLYALLYHREQYPKLDWRTIADITKIPFAESKFDLVFNFRLMQHLKTTSLRIAALQELQRVTKQWALVSMYITSPFHHFSKKIAAHPPRIVMIPAAQWQKEIKQAGFQLIKTIPVVPCLHAHHIFLLETI